MKRISIVASVALMGALGFSGCGSSGSSTPSSSSSTSSTSSEASSSSSVATATITGKAIDGYIAGANVSFAGFTGVTGTGGAFSIAGVPMNSTGLITITSDSDSIDESTGEAYEGVLKGLVTKDSGTVVTPLTTLVIKQLESEGKELSEANFDVASEALATKLGISKDYMNVDLVEALDKESDSAKKLEIAEAIKVALTIQKTAEGLAKAVGSTDVEMVEVAYKSILSVINEDVETRALKVNFLTVNFAKIISIYAENIKEKIADAQAKLDLVKDVLEASIVMVEDMDITTLTTIAMLNTISKAIEVLTAQVELALIVANLDGVQNILKAISMMGGIIGLSDLVGDLKTAGELTTAFNKQKDASVELYNKTFGTEFKKDSIKVVTKEFATIRPAKLSQAERASKMAEVFANLSKTLTLLITVDSFLSAYNAILNIIIDTVKDIVTNYPTSSSSGTTSSATTSSTASSTTGGSTSSTAGGGYSPSSGYYAYSVTTTTIPDNMKGVASISDTALNVSSIQGTAISSGSASITQNYIKLTSSCSYDSCSDGGYSYKYSALKANLTNYYDVELNATDTTSALNKNVAVTVIIKASTDYITATTTANFAKVNNALVVTVPADANLTLTGSYNGTNYSVSDKNNNANFITSSLSGTTQTMNFSMANVISKFDSNSAYGAFIKQTVTDNVTKAGSYETYLIINDATTGTSFIGNSGATLTDTNIISGINTATGLTLQSGVNALKVNVTLQ